MNFQILRTEKNQCQPYFLSIKPQYVKKILKGKKRYEFRKNKPKRSVTRMVIYASWPQQQVVGEAIIDEILEGQPDEIWDITKRIRWSLISDFSLHFSPPYSYAKRGSN